MNYTAFAIVIGFVVLAMAATLYEEWRENK